MVVWLHIGALTGYVAAALVLSRALAGGERTAPRSAAALATAGAALHVAAAASYAVRYGELPLVGLGPSLSTFALLTAVLSLAVLWLRDVRPIGVVLLPLASVLLTLGVLLGIEPAHGEMAFRGLWFALHVLLTFAGYACFAGAFAAGLLYLLQHRELKEKRFGRMFRFFPALATLGQWQRRAVELALISLTLGLAVGWGWTTRFAPLPVSHPKVVWGVISWAIILGALVAQRGSARERRGAIASVVGFALVVASYLVLRLTESAGDAFL
ncbi:MAG TPA: cytochrome c biogenesis protein CcsA [Longimicrobiales bacterium]|nr:cytochrome c biogenesis protein CcsA [Longimicrobiales bacterium]